MTVRALFSTRGIPFSWSRRPFTLALWLLAKQRKETVMGWGLASARLHSSGMQCPMKREQAIVQKAPMEST